MHISQSHLFLETSLRHAFHTSWHYIQLILYLFRKEQSTEHYHQQIFQQVKAIICEQIDVRSILKTGLNWLFTWQNTPFRPLLVQFKPLNGLSWFFPIDTFSGSGKLLQDLFWFFPVNEYSRLLLVQLKSLNALSRFFPVDTFSGSGKSLQDLFWFFRVKEYSRP